MFSSSSILFMYFDMLTSLANLINRSKRTILINFVELEVLEPSLFVVLPNADVVTVSKGIHDTQSMKNQPDVI